MIKNLKLHIYYCIIFWKVDSLLQRLDNISFIIEQFDTLDIALSHRMSRSNTRAQGMLLQWETIIVGEEQV